MLYGMTTRLGWSGDPRPLWQYFDAFGIPDTDLVIHLGLVILAYGIDAFSDNPTFQPLYSEPLTVYEPLEILLP